MNEQQIREMSRTTTANVTELSNVAIEALRRATRAEEVLTTVNGQLTTANENLENSNRVIAGLRRDLATASTTPTPPAPQPTPTEVSMDFSNQPGTPDVSRQVRFLSKSSAMGGLANIRAQMNDIGINAKRMRLEGSSYTPNNDILVINWGGGFDIPSNMSGFTGTHLNKLDAVKIAASKLKTFDKLKADEYLKNFIPIYATSKTTANRDIPDESAVYVRNELYGHSGEGIEIVPAGETVTITAPLYVEGLNIKHEYRVHTVNGFTKIQKKARLGTENPNMLIRNFDNGWTFINEFTLGDRGKSELHDLAVKTLACLGLDFGAVDLIRTEENTWKVLEVNTAPGVTAESNIEWYTKALLAQ